MQWTQHKLKCWGEMLPLCCNQHHNSVPYKCLKETCTYLHLEAKCKIGKQTLRAKDAEGTLQLQVSQLLESIMPEKMVYHNCSASIGASGKRMQFNVCMTHYITHLATIFGLTKAWNIYSENTRSMTRNLSYEHSTRLAQDEGTVCSRYKCAPA